MAKDHLCFDRRPYRNSWPKITCVLIKCIIVLDFLWLVHRSPWMWMLAVISWGWSFARLNSTQALVQTQLILVIGLVFRPECSSLAWKEALIHPVCKIVLYILGLVRPTVSIFSNFLLGRKKRSDLAGRWSHPLFLLTYLQALYQAVCIVWSKHFVDQKLRGSPSSG